MSRARLGLYVFGRRSLFEQCLELQPALGQLMGLPTQLALVPTEEHPTQRAVGSLASGAVEVAGPEGLASLVNALTLRWQAAAAAGGGGAAAA